jgi:hypothetical protein
MGSPAASSPFKRLPKSSRPRITRYRGCATNTSSPPRTIVRVKAALARRPDTRVLTVAYRDAVADPLAAAKKLNEFLGGGLDLDRMVRSVDSRLHRNRNPAGIAPVQGG